MCAIVETGTNTMHYSTHICSFHKFPSAIFRTPEEAEEYLSKLQKIKKARTKPTPPTHLKSSDLNDWYSQQRQFELQERKKREEAELLLRGYRAKYENGSSDVNKSPTPPKSGLIAEGSIETGENIVVSDEIKKYNTDPIVENKSSKKKEETGDVDEVSNDEEKKDEVVEVVIDAKIVHETTDDNDASVSVVTPVITDSDPDDDDTDEKNSELVNIEEPSFVEDAVEESHQKGEETKEELHVKEEEPVVQAKIAEDEEEKPALKEETSSPGNVTEEGSSSISKEGWRNMIKNGKFQLPDQRM